MLGTIIRSGKVVYDIVNPKLQEIRLKKEIKNKLKENNLTMENLINKATINNRLGKQTVKFANPPKIIGNMTIVGKKEGKGPLNEYFHQVLDNDKCGEKTFEMAEEKILENCIRGAINNAKIQEKDLDAIFSGDLLNQITVTGYAARQFDASLVGLYGACSTSVEGIALASAMIDGGFFDTCACAASSHFSTAERTFRGPLEYGCQRPPYAQWTVTGTGCSVLSSSGNGPKVTHATFGRIVDFGICDISNMGAAMAPSAADTFKTFFIESGFLPSDFDMIVTGDLGKLGSDILRKLMYDYGFDLGSVYCDCGAMIYDVKQKAFQGGSGCGCSAAVFNSMIMHKLKTGQLGRVLYAATGALMSVVANQQGHTIPAICHAVVIEGR